MELPSVVTHRHRTRGAQRKVWRNDIAQTVNQTGGIAKHVHREHNRMADVLANSEAEQHKESIRGYWEEEEEYEDWWQWM